MCQRHYHSLLKFVHIVKMRYTKAKNQFDLLLRPINEKDKTAYIILQGNTKYLFRVSEFQQIIVTCISNTEEYFPEILDIKNPYNNMKITHTILYDFYFYLKTNNYKIDELFNAYFNSNFNSKEYLSKYEVIIRDRSITQEIKTAHHDKLYPYVIRMFLQYARHLKGIHISCGFPRKKLVELMKPYLQLYFYQLYYPRDLPRKYESEDALIKRLKELALISPDFGKRTLTNETSSDGNLICYVKYNCLIPGFHRPLIYCRGGTSHFLTIDIKDDIQYYKMMGYFNSAAISLVKHTNFHCPDMEEEYVYYMNKYYERQMSRMAKNNREEEKDSDDEISNTDDTLVDSDDELEVTVTNLTNLTNNETVSNNVTTNTNDNANNDELPNEELHDDMHEVVSSVELDINGPEPRTTIPVPFASNFRTEMQINENPNGYLILPTEDNVTLEQPQTNTMYDEIMTQDNELNDRTHINDLNHTELMTEHHELMERVVSTFNEVSQRLNAITSAPNFVTTNDNDSGSSMSISEPSDNAYERDDSVVIGPTIENEEQCNEENSDDNSSIETDPDVNIISGIMSSQSVNNELKGKYIVRAMTGSRETGYNTELQETFYTEEVANHFYENIALLHYNLKEIEFIPFELLTSYETPEPRNILNSEEKKAYDASKYTTNNETNETREICSDVLEFLCEECNLQSMRNKCYICKRHDICNYCNGDSVWCKQNEDWMCRDCHNNRQQEECIEQEDEDEEEIVSSSLMTYGIPANSDIHPSEYIRNRIEEMTRESYLDKGFTEENYDEMQQLRLEEYGSDGDY